MTRKPTYRLLDLYRSKQHQVYIDGLEARRVEVFDKPTIEAGSEGDPITYTIRRDLDSSDGTFDVTSDEGYDIKIQFLKRL